MKRRWLVGPLTGLLVLSAAEFGVRLMGLTDFPLYLADDRIGYIPAPNQSGAFLNKNRWYFNEKSMGIEQPFSPSMRADVLLIGDSIVLGGNAMDQPAKLGAVLSKITEKTYWPISAGSWALLNEIRYLQQHPEVLQRIDEFEFVVNSADFDQASSWACEVTHPREHPKIMVPYLFEKYLLKREPCGVTPQVLQVNHADWRVELAKIMKSPAAIGKPVTFWLYPTQAESRDALMRKNKLERQAVEILSAMHGAPVQILSLARHPNWSSVQYMDAIHPTADGTRVMAEIMTSADKMPMRIP